MPRLAIDLSNYSGPVSRAQADALYAAGVRMAIVQFVNERVLTHELQIPNLQAVGIEVRGYNYVWFSAGEDFVKRRAEWACNEASKYQVNDIYLDCEQTADDTPPFDHVNLPVSPCIRVAVAAVRAAGKRPGIYTADWWWRIGASNSTEWSDLPLWDAFYDYDPDIDEVSYGGWRVPAVSQYQANVTLAGVPFVDLNAYEGTPDPAPPATPVIDVAAIDALLTEARKLIMDAYNLLHP